MKLKLLIVCIVCVAIALPAFADTLTLKSGQVITGVFMSRNDSGGVVFVGPDGVSQTYPAEEVQSLTFGALPKPAAPAAPPPQAVNVPVGTVLIIRVNQAIDTSSAYTGQLFTGNLATDLAANGYVVAPTGTPVYGQILEAKSAKRGSGKSTLKLQLTQIVVNGMATPIVSSVLDSEGKSSTKRSARRLLGGAGLGAAIGAIAGNAGMGAAIGAASGAALAVVQKGDQVQVPAESQLQFTLQQAISLPALH